VEFEDELHPYKIWLPPEVTIQPNSPLRHQLLQRTQYCIQLTKNNRYIEFDHIRGHKTLIKAKKAYFYLRFASLDKEKEMLAKMRHIDKLFGDYTRDKELYWIHSDEESDYKRLQGVQV
jgi:hypothetical protein